MLSSVKTVARKAGVAWLYRHLYRKPKNRVEKSIRRGGPVEQWKTQKGKEEMQEAAGKLPPLNIQPNGKETCPRVHFLTGKNHWYQTLFCFVSLQRFSDTRIVPVLYSDGSLKKPYRQKFRRVVPWTEVRTKSDIEARLDEALPRDQFSLLRKWRDIQPLTRKITDLHAGESGWKLLLDSDMLFFRRPNFILNWLSNPSQPCYMVDCETAYGYSPQLRYEMSDGAIPEAANIGIFGWKSEEVDFSRIQNWIENLVELEGRKYNITQAICSLMFAGRDCSIAPSEAYVVRPSVEEGKLPSGTLYHYVAESERTYFQHGWRHVAREMFGEK
jgi:hypothetical protein